jgi:hypothetical protein
MSTDHKEYIFREFASPIEEPFKVIPHGHIYSLGDMNEDLVSSLEKSHIFSIGRFATWRSGTLIHQVLDEVDEIIKKLGA